MLTKVISGGQTGVDRAALDAAINAGLPVGGWCPQGRRAEDGIISLEYPLAETPFAEYAQRTEWNVRAGDGTLLLRTEAESKGTDRTEEMAHKMGKPLLILNLQVSPEPDQVRQWLHEQQIVVLNIAGPRESESPGIYDSAKVFLDQLFGSKS